MKEIVVKNRSLIQHINENDNILISKKRKQEIFDTTKDRVDVILYDNQENLLSKKSNITSYAINVDSTLNSGSVFVNPDIDIPEMGYELGDFIIEYRFIRNLIDSEVYISSISSDRKSITLDSTRSNISILANQFITLKDRIDNTAYYFPILLYFLNKNDQLITNITVTDKITVTLYNELSSEVKVKDIVEIVEEISNPVKLSLELLYTFEEEIPTSLRSPNFDIYVSKSDVETDYLSQNVELSFDSDSFINVDYYSFENFVHFGSAKEMLVNFMYKIASIEYFIENNDTKKLNDILSNLTDYEKYLYNIYPKVNDVPISLEDQSIIDWLGDYDENSDTYSGLLNVANDYDLNNPDYLIYFLPDFIREVEANKPVLLFTSMFGEVLDNIWIETKQITKNLEQSNNTLNGVASGFVDVLLKNSGLFYSILNNDNSSVNKEIYKRLYHNIPYLLKTKGTEEAIRSLLSTVGIPDTLVKIQEGVSPIQKESIQNKTATGVFTVPVKKANENFWIRTIEFRAKTNYSKSLLSVDDKWYIYTTTNGIGFKIWNGTQFITNEQQFSIKSDEWLYFSLTKETVNTNSVFKLNVGNTHGYWRTLTITIPTETYWPFSLPTTLSIGHTGIKLQEFRLWNTVITSDILKLRLTNPLNIQSNTDSGFYNNLFYRLSFGANGKASSGTTLTSEHYNSSINYGVTNMSSISYTNNIEQLNKLNWVKYSSEISTDTLYPLYKNKESEIESNNDEVTIGFSTSIEENRDILNTFGLDSINSTLAMPDEKFSKVYSKYVSLKNIYNTKRNGYYNVNKFIRASEQYGNIVNNTINDFIPFNNGINVGVIIKQSLLERSKYQYLKPIATLTNIFTGIDVYPSFTSKFAPTVHAKSNFNHKKSNVTSSFNILSNFINKFRDGNTLYQIGNRTNGSMLPIDFILGISNNIKNTTEYSGIGTAILFNPIFPNDTFLNIKYLINTSKSLIDLNINNKHWYWVTGIFPPNSIIVLSKISPKTEKAQIFQGKQKVIESGYNYHPIFYISDTDTQLIFKGKDNIKPYVVEAGSLGYFILPSVKLTGIYNIVKKDPYNIFTTGNFDTYSEYKVIENGAYTVNARLDMSIISDDIKSDVTYRLVAYKNKALPENIIYKTDHRFQPRNVGTDSAGNPVYEDPKGQVKSLDNPLEERFRDAFNKYWAHEENSLDKPIPYNSNATWKVVKKEVKNGVDYITFENSYKYRTPALINLFGLKFVDAFIPRLRETISIQLPTRNIVQTTINNLLDNQLFVSLKKGDKILVGMEVINANNNSGVKTNILPSSTLTIRQDGKKVSEKEGFIINVLNETIQLSSTLVQYFNPAYTFSPKDTKLPNTISLFDKYGTVNYPFYTEVGDGMLIRSSITGTEFYSTIKSVEANDSGLYFTLSEVIPAELTKATITELLLVKRIKDESIIRLDHTITESTRELFLVIPEHINDSFIANISSITKYIKDNTLTDI